jgi:hypothetical protein
MRRRHCRCERLNSSECTVTAALRQRQGIGATRGSNGIGRQKATARLQAAQQDEAAAGGEQAGLRAGGQSGPPSRHQAAHDHPCFCARCSPELPQLQTAHVTGGRASEGRQPQCIRVRLTRLHLVAMGIAAER